MRLWNPEYTNLSAAEKKEVYKADVHGRMQPYIEIFYSGTSSANATAVGGAADLAKDGSTTPFKVNVVSASANDTNTSAGHVRKVRIIGISVPCVAGDATIAAATGTVDPNWSGQEAYTVEQINMAGATDVYSQRFWIHVMHFYACDWGSGDGDAADAITLESPANTTLLTIAQNGNESNGAIIYGAAGHYGRWSRCVLGSADRAFNNA